MEAAVAQAESESPGWAAGCVVGCLAALLAARP